MSLFQKSVLKKYLQGADKEKVHQAWMQFQAHFHNSEIQENIRNAKEEEYQEGFVRDLFVNNLGYTLKPQPNYNFVLEKKTETDATKSDGAMLRGENIISVIELKDTGTTEFDKIEKQVFGYKHKHKNCVYVITSNFEKLRFYINDATEYEDFNLFTLTEERFAILYLCLQQKSIQNDVPLKMRQVSETEEENITKKLYADYSIFKRLLFNNIVELNPDFNKLELFKKTQKLLDRFLFILFAEDRLLVPPNSVREILQQWEQLKELDNYIPLYDRFIKYFGYLNTGYEGNQYEIFAYNGGLFAPDEILDIIKVDDQILYDGCKTLSHYDFESEVDVNILGHIFEHSLGEIEEVQAELEGNVIDKTKTRRKKDGVFYTPRYITKYIVENTLGELCAKKKEALKINEEIFTIRKRKDKKRERLVAIIDEYRQWLLQLTICDPACGSGAFLNQALEYLIAEHRYIDELKATFLGDALVLSDLENEILQNNLFGVDINEEAVEIARLSLWLRTAKKGRKLSNLSHNIKCGNSLIDEAEVGGKKAFHWKEEFNSIFENGGFDVIIGNPPWGAKLDTVSSKYLVDKYPLVPTKLKDTYMYFMLLCLELIKPKSYLGLIVPNTWLLINNTADFRKYFLNLAITQIIDHGDNVFSDAIVESATIILQNEQNKDRKVFSAKYRGSEEIVSHDVDKQIWLDDELHRIVLELKVENYSIIKKMETCSEPFEKNSEIIFGIKPYQVGHATPSQTQEMVDQRIYHSVSRINEEWHPLVTGTDVTRYSLSYSGGEYIRYGKWLMYPSNQNKINANKILLRRTSHDLKAAFDSDSYYPQNSLFIITSTYNLKYLLCLLNSKLFDFVYKTKCPQVGKVFAEVKPSIIKSLPIAKANDELQIEFSQKADFMQEKYKELNLAKQQLIKLALSKYDGLTMTKKLTDWSSWPFKEFIKELGKQKILVSISEQAEWMQYFETEKIKTNEILADINRTDKEIDGMVYRLYGLKMEEQMLVEDLS